MERKVKTPCVGVCSTVFGDQVCRGCKRFHHEVIEWNGYTDVQKETVWNRLESLKVLIMKSKIFIENQVLLQSKLDSLKISYYDKVDPYCWVFDLIKQASQSINDLSEFGLKPLFEPDVELVELKRLIEEELFTLSDAHYQRYFALEDNYRV
ncbi:MAG TPA: DUF1289 domain-containing protein [Gammaproteobacteria bacterium]|jgi:hypothetical protein|nr:DUF1289 domain-containing protein [Gammaproteobacteria bacterium]HIA43391.1 DUF1289 domain-containing protein [Gammaproteobacteria bacterium]HIA95984.1 DUF1289 domain-containing protein [Gammaproteobacteria bacterium]HIB74368.1 DUF1289 domain-containing protein [Gammaproteobacteria bacterium]HIM21807.1 DUF1289 domain-containing protein [Gammaproteobacteria bacterium]|tara:strand:- start:700 stop:1155 length:456 start_codon:yes stop_codon:yes gene_type:complete